MADALIDALIDTLKLVPWLLVMHVLIEVFEYHAVSGIKLNKALKGPLAPLIGGACGILPQCGFGVVSADLYSRRSIRLGTMVAVFVATSDEAVPILLSNPTAASLTKLGVLLGFKFAAALIAGYALNFVLRKRELTEIDFAVAALKGCHRHELGEHTHEHAHGHCEENNQEKNERKKKAFDFKCFVLHPLLHTLTVSAYILGVNLLFAVVMYYVGETRVENFLLSAKFLQPLLAGLVGLIPNCASSVILAQMFARGSITLGAAFAGLSINAGIGLAVLIKKNRPFKNTFYIIAGLYAYSVTIGLVLSLLPI